MAKHQGEENTELGMNDCYNKNKKKTQKKTIQIIVLKITGKLICDALFTRNNLLNLFKSLILHKLPAVIVFTIWVNCTAYQLFCTDIVMHLI